MAYLRKESWLFITPETAKDTKTVTDLWSCRAEGTVEELSANVSCQSYHFDETKQLWKLILKVMTSKSIQYWQINVSM